MSYLFDIIIFIIGSAVGSFLNVVIFRLEKEDIVKKRSHCPLCGRVLAWHDLIPILSFIVLRGRCRNCREKISWQYPLVEAATGALFVAIFNFQIADQIDLIYRFFIISCCVVIFVYDLRHYIIPDKVLFPAVIISLIYRLFEVSGLKAGHLLGIGSWRLEILYPYLLSAIAAAAFFLFLALATRGRGMGMGDVKLTFFMGLVLGWPGILFALFSAFFSGAAAGLVLIALKRKTMKSQIPFGPFLVFGTLAALFWGQFLSAWLGFLALCG
ncbi:MAG: prepilin peptidase [Candidatus Portnoybacteria bacterium]|nr:prepilin peptidase [Candidatus Portnoybacteria bacterium]MDD4982892.1 prepilin peptidase [Candidatus Portnoybacteria bacterium]